MPTEAVPKEPQKAKVCIVRNPATEKILAEYPFLSKDEIHKKIDQAEVAWQSWRSSTWKTRTIAVKKIAALLRGNLSDYAQLITHEMGKPIAQAEQEVEKCAWMCEHYADEAEAYLKPRIISSDNQKSYVIYEPLGIVFGIMPWNFPFWQVIRFAIPSILAGNAALLKHAPNVAGCSIALEKLFAAAGFPPHLFTSLVMEVEHCEEVIHHRAVAAVSVTGSDKTGRIVAAQAGKALKKTVLELGGSDPYIILDDVDVKQVAHTLLSSRVSNAGQSCISPKRILAVDKIREKLQAHMTLMARDIAWGNPAHKDIKLGPLARADLRDHLHKQVTDTVVQGAHLECGGFIPEEMGYFYPMTVLTEVPKGTPAYDEELFGPVISFIPVKDEAHAIEVANDTRYGLSSGIFTNDIKRAEVIATHLMAGGVFINKCTVSDPRLPFGGIKDSGYGRELDADGIREFTNIKTIVIA